MDFNEFLKSLPKIKNIPLPGEVSHYKMVPPFRKELLKHHQKAVPNAKRAGVLALFYPDSNAQTKFVLILRKTYKGVHSAQIGFPGGKLETQDVSIEATAVRETFEEVGVPEKKISVIKALSKVYIPPSNFFVHPFIGVIKDVPRFFRQEDEVEAVLEITLEHFLEHERLITKHVTTSYSVDVEVPAFNLNGYVVWGATAMILSEIKDLLKQAL
ncbi:NUDIX hydrolase [Snuella sedimenti]|uniref:CoA pyrophosphatase n=1 Tax=Snuella sedimenti TaxID=2798802 RepID=A0A8J7IWH2_9FLAO|nr:CoA pyrophosphatase [Snuella sedimenti]MBJ6368495.1 CoA pyrophosphatase [Snuella sedimenti]